jgi:hypothetical protein
MGMDELWPWKQADIARSTPLRMSQNMVDEKTILNYVWKMTQTWRQVALRDWERETDRRET